jgi:hypothetical protein
MSPEQEFADLFLKMYKLCEKHNWGDPFSYARAKEIYLANVLDHMIVSTYNGADAVQKDGLLVEYKSTIAEKIHGAYNGISVFPNWTEQEKYLIEEKLGKYAFHYFARFEGGNIVEVWKLKGEDILKILIPKLKKQFHSNRSKSKDPRLGSNVSTREIMKYGERIR